MKKYELIYFISLNLSGEEAKSLSQKVSGFIEKQGKLERTEDPRKKKMAYPVKEAFMSVIIFSFEPDQLKILESKLKADTQIIRYMITIKKAIKKVPERKLKKILSPKEPERLSFLKPRKEEIHTETKKVELKEIDQKIEEILKD